MSGPDVLTRDDDIDVVGLFSQVKKRRWLIAVVTLISAISLFVGLSMISPRYNSSARILIENYDSVFTRTTEESSERREPRFDQQAVRSQVEVLGSDELALQVIRDLKLTENSEFGDGGIPSILNDLMVLTGLRNGGYGATLEERALRKFAKQLDVYAIEQSRVIVVEFKSTSPKLAQQVPNAIAEAFIELQKKNRQTTTSDATEYLGPEIEAMRKRLRGAEARVAEFRGNSDLLVGQNNASLATQQLSEVSTELSRLRAERSSAEAKIASIRSALESGSSIDVIPEVIASPLIQRLRERQVALKAQISDLSTSLLPNHPNLKSLNSQVADFENQIRSAAKNILKSLENNVDLAQKTEQDMIKEVNRLKSEAARVGEAEVELRALEREAAAERELLQTYLRRFREAAGRQSEGFFPVDARIISRAVLPIEPYFPKVVPYSIAGAFAMMVLSVIGILSATLLSGAAMRPMVNDMNHYMPETSMVKPAGHYENFGGLHGNEIVSAQDEVVFTQNMTDPAAVNEDQSGELLPEFAEAPSLDDFQAPNDMVESKSLQVRYAASVIAELESARILITSPGGDSGSRSVWMLARSLARSGRKVLVIDLGGGGLTSQEMLGSSDMPGLFDTITGHAAFENVLFRDRVSNSHVIPAGNLLAVDNPPDLEDVSIVIDTIAEPYEIVIIDCGDTDTNGIEAVSEPSDIVVISGIGAEQSDCDLLEQRLQSNGYGEVIQIVPDSVDSEREALVAA